MSGCKEKSPSSPDRESVRPSPSDSINQHNVAELHHVSPGMKVVIPKKR